MNMRLTAEYWIKKLKLTTHREGGSFREIYRSSSTIAQSPSAFNGHKSYSTGIYYLLTHGQFSAFHRIASDEIWHFYYGDPLSVYEIDLTGKLTEYLLGSDPKKGQAFQCAIKGGNWFAAKPLSNSEYSLVGCTVALWFNFKDFELADRNKLTRQFPQHRLLIHSLTR